VIRHWLYHRRVTLAWLLAAAVLIGLIVATVVVFPSLLVSNTQGMTRTEVLQTENQVRATLLTGIAGALFLVTALLTWRQIQIAREGQITDRYETAVKQLAGDLPTERIGGIFALARLAIDSDRDEQTVVELLSAFVRDQTSKDADDLSGYLSDRHRDVQVALDVLGRSELRTAPRFDGANLVGAYMSYGHFVCARFAWTNLSAARFVGADLRDSVLRGANLQGTNLAQADLRGAQLLSANLSGADLRGTRLEGIRYDRRTVWPKGFLPPLPPLT
jgi:Pentapeptide repeats (8 copies)